MRGKGHVGIERGREREAMEGLGTWRERGGGTHGYRERRRGQGQGHKGRAGRVHVQSVTWYVSASSSGPCGENLRPFPSLPAGT